MRIENEIIEKLQPLKGINLDVAFRIFRDKKLDVKQSGFVENVIALLIDRELPKNERGMDFKGLFEVKEMKVKFTKKGKMTNLGDTNISSYLNSEPDFFESNIWDKSNKILIVCVDQNRVVVDVRFFDGEPYAEIMKSDYEAIKEAKNLCRQNNKILVFKTGYNSIMMKGNTAIDMSTSILSDNEIEISNQEIYILDLFSNKFESYVEKRKSIVEQIELLMNRISITDLEVIKNLAELKLKENIGFNMKAGKELSF